MTADTQAPATSRAFRPRDRKQQIMSAAAELFYRHGYANVSTEQIAKAVGITPGALYRHFAGKQDLLAQALTDVFDRAIDIVAPGPTPSLEAMVDGLAHTAGVRRDLGILWSRETRHLDDDARAQMRAPFFDFLEQFGTQLQVLRPELSTDDAELLAWCVVGVLTSPSYHATPMQPDRMVELLRTLAMAVCTTPLQHQDAPSPAAGEIPAGPGLSPRSRREHILRATTKLFYEKGFQSVTMGDVGTAVGMTSAGVYKYFDNKAELLSATIARASEPLQLGLSRALSKASTPEQGLANAFDAYVDFAMVHHDLVGILVSEVTNLPEPQRRLVRRAQRDYVAEWVALLAAYRPELSRAECRYVVQSVLTLVNDVTRTATLMKRPSLTQELRLIGRRLMAVEC